MTSPLLSPQSLADLRALLGRATPAPWQHDAALDRTCVMNSAGVYLAECDVGMIPADEMVANAAFLAAARSALPALLDEVARLRAALAAVDTTLRVPAAEYVPAIADAFTLIDAALAPSEAP